MHDAYDAEDADEGEVSSRGATMSSIVFRDLSTSASTSRSSSPWQQGGLSPGLAMFATTSFGGEPLRVLANVDEELGAAHMGPRIYKRHNQKHVRNRFRAKMEAGFINEQEDVSKASTQGQSAAGRTLGTGTDEDAALTEEDKERLRRVDLQKLIFLDILDAFTRLPDHISSPAELLAEVLASIDNTHADPLVDLVGELVGLCGQQMSSNPTILTETQDRTLVSASSFLSLCFTLNSSRPASTRLPTHAFYCTVLDLAPFLEHFVHHAASLVRTTSASGLAQFNICRSPFLLSLGAKVRALQLENELRLSRAPRQSQVQRFEEGGTEAELVVLPTSLSLKVERHAAWEQSKALFLQLLESGATVRGLRVVFAGEQAADGGGPAREWFASVASSWSGVDKVVGPHGWFIASAVEDEDQVEETAAFLGMLLALAALHTTKVALSFTLPAVAFKIATAPKLDELVLTPVDLEFADAALAKSLQSVLDWKPSSSASGDVDRLFDSTFSLTWSTSIRTADGEIKTIDLVPGGRHRSVKVGERRQFVSKLVWRVLVGSVSRQVTAFRDAWQSIMPSSWLSHNNDPKKHGTGITVESATDILSKGGLAASLFSPEELAQALLSLPTASSLSALSQPLDISDLRAATEVIVPSSLPPTQVVDWFWSTWSDLSPLHQRRLLAFITGAQDLPASGARGIGLRIHLVATDAVSDFRSWPLPWSSTCTSTLFLPTYPTHSLLADKVRIAIEHYQGFGLR
uniref:HECT-type E3 ubiquitin transferase n=1 Tax=Kalmanozyma brasiliensis (strain GHG001) TaxID=1365824 RepID=V5F0B0_KALBG